MLTIRILCFTSLVMLSDVCVFEIYPQQKNGDVNSLIELLQSNDKIVQLEALKNLYDLGPAAKDAVPYLMNALNKGDNEIKEKAAETLGEIKDNTEETILALLQCFYDDNPYLNGKAVDALAKIGAETVPYLKEYLKDGNDNVRWCSAITLSKIIPASKLAVPELVEALEDDNENVRWSSIVALGNLGVDARDAIPSLLKTLDDNDEEIRWASYIALKKIEENITFEIPEVTQVESDIDSLVPKLMEDLHVPGVSISIISNREIAFTKSFGVKNVNTSEQVTNETLFEACSMTKPVFAYTALKLAEQNKLDLDAPLFNYLEEPFYGSDSIYKRITAKMILTHTSGLPNWRKGEEERNGPLPVYFKPGERFSYSGEGFFYLQRVVEKITGKPLEDYAKDTFFQPLGLKHTSYVWTGEIDSLISCGHDTLGNFLAKSKYTHPNSAYTLYTTASDFADLIVEILKTDRSSAFSLTKKTIEEMLMPQIDVLVRDPIDRPGRALGLFVYWGLGWAIDSTASGKIFYHSGANRTGFRCYSQFNFKEGSGIVIMTNGLNGSELWRRLIKEIGDL